MNAGAARLNPSSAGSGGINAFVVNELDQDTVDIKTLELTGGRREASGTVARSSDFRGSEK